SDRSGASGRPAWSKSVAPLARVGRDFLLEARRHSRPSVILNASNHSHNLLFDRQSSEAEMRALAQARGSIGPPKRRDRAPTQSANAIFFGWPNDPPWSDLAA